MAKNKKNVNENENVVEETVVEETAVAVVTAPVDDITSLFSSLDVQALNSAIENIANREGTMSDSERTAALEVVDSWNTGVVQAINDESSKIKEFLRNVKDFTQNYKSLMTNPDFADPLQRLIEIAGLQDMAAQIGDAIAAADDADAELRIVQNTPLDIDETIATEFEKIDARAARTKEIVVARTAADKAARTRNRLISEFNRALNGNSDVKAAVSSLTAFDRRLVRSANTCKNKANAAKLAISLDNKDLRDKLSALINISIK